MMKAVAIRIAPIGLWKAAPTHRLKNAAIERSIMRIAFAGKHQTAHVLEIVWRLQKPSHTDDIFRFATSWLASMICNCFHMRARK